jgi:hypothetical protein
VEGNEANPMTRRACSELEFVQIAKVELSAPAVKREAEEDWGKGTLATVRSG